MKFIINMENLDAPHRFRPALNPGCAAPAVLAGRKREPSNARQTPGFTAVYLVHFFPSDFGNGAIGFEVEKLDADLATVESYHVHLADRPEACSCECKGFLRWNHCKHLDGLKALNQAGKFPRLYTARDARRDPEPQEPPQLDEVAYFDPAELDDPA